MSRSAFSAVDVIEMTCAPGSRRIAVHIPTRRQNPRPGPCLLPSPPPPPQGGASGLDAHLGSRSECESDQPGRDGHVCYDFIVQCRDGARVGTRASVSARSDGACHQRSLRALPPSCGPPHPRKGTPPATAVDTPSSQASGSIAAQAPPGSRAIRQRVHTPISHEMEWFP
jgi:hypothetical protein